MDNDNDHDDSDEGDRRERVRLSDLQHPDGGIKCPDCGGTWFRVIATSRKTDKIVRRRACRRCGRQILTTERLTG